MKKIMTLVSLLLLFSLDLWATAQIPDIIIYKGDTLALHDCPLYTFPNQNLLNTRKLFGSKGCFFTACWRNYVATWEIIDDELFLTKIKNACYTTDTKGVAITFKEAHQDSIGNEFADLKSLFPDRYHNGKVKADWVNKTMYAPSGKLLHYVHAGFASTYEFEYKFEIKNGRLLAVEKLDNRKAKWTVFTSENKKDTLAKFINSKINWSRLPKLPKDSIVKIVVNFSANENGVIDHVKLIDSTKQNRFTDEAIRVVRTIPEWDVYFEHGKFIKSTANVLVNFVQPIENDEMLQLIAHDKNIAVYSNDQKIQIIKNREKIGDSIKVCYYKEYRKKDSRDYRFSYIFIDYSQNNKYIQKILLEKDQFINEYVIMDAQKKKLIKHDSNIPKSIEPKWYPLTYYHGKFYNYQIGSRFYCSITDSIVNTPRRYNDTYIIRDFSIIDKTHFNFKLTRFEENETLDVYFLDKKHKYALMKFRGKFQLYADRKEIEKFPIISHNYKEWIDLRDEFEKIEAEINKLPKDIDSLRVTIPKIINLNQ